jgi:hypothetical protein
MRQAFAHEAVLAMPAAGDDGAPGAAITTALCGSPTHEGACTWPHHTAAAQRGDTLRLRILFACEPRDEGSVRAGIAGALGGGALGHPTWTVVSQAPARLDPSETDHAARLCSDPR